MCIHTYLPLFCPLLLSALSFVVRLGNTPIHTSKVYELRRGESNGEIMLSQDIPLCGDIKVEFYHNPRLGRKVGSSFYIVTGILHFLKCIEQLDFYSYNMVQCLLSSIYSMCYVIYTLCKLKSNK